MNDGFPFREELRARLIEAQDRRNKRRNWLASDAAVRVVSLAAALALIIGGASVALAALSENSAEAGVLSVTRSGDTTIVRLLDLQSRPSQIEDELRENDIEVTVDEVPMPESAVGKFIYLDSATGLLPVNAQSGVFTEFQTKDESDTEITLSLGRLAAASENYAVGVDAFGEYGPLHCSGIVGQRVGDALDEIDALQVGVDWQAFSSRDGVRNVGVAEVSRSFVTGGTVTAQDRLLIRVSTDVPDVTVVDEARRDC